MPGMSKAKTNKGFLQPGINLPPFFHILTQIDEKKQEMVSSDNRKYPGNL
jgi:hypothetical protein